MAKRYKIERFFARLLDYKRSYLHLRRRRKEFSAIFINKRSKIALKKTILRDLVPNCGPLAGVGGTNPPNLPPPAYAHDNYITMLLYISSNELRVDPSNGFLSSNNALTTLFFAVNIRKLFILVALCV